MKKKTQIMIPQNTGMGFAKPFGMRKKILIVDDDEGIRDIFRIIFEKAGYAFEIKSSAKDLLENHFSFPDLILLDKQISGIDGLQICRHLKSQNETKDIPVIIVSATPDIGIMAKKAGANDYIEKPFMITHLLETIERNLNKTRRISRKKV